MSQRFKLGVLLAFPLPVVLISLMLGSSESLNIVALLQYLQHYIMHDFRADLTVNSSEMEIILCNIRLPRVLLTFLVGASLASCGGTLQAIFRNPIVDPFILGISSGAAFGAALAIVFPLLSLNISAFSFGIVAVVLTYFISYSKSKTNMVSVVLSGMMVSGIFTACLTILQYLSDPYKLQAIVQWTMGNLHTASWEKLQYAAPPIILGLTVMMVLRWKLNLLALGDDEAKAVGVNPMALKILLIAATTLVTAAAVAAVGVISLFGLVVPHMSRMIFGASNVHTTTSNICIGGMLLLIIDDFSRSVMPFEIPIGVFTILIGAPIFIYLMKKTLIYWNS
ncbi:FecCD family ABC transporter permease [Flavobacterium sp. '19STA2R22 D10 B1']|uniref:FecCD family ABC transporter permease n=1 Tax=Flavobacterium aerium TaxID=3037261 RepID=UPI00278C2A2F|nr:iron ABC transporter permease [Flavobacterium sp. '19STA2R22 D10 B1']